MICALLLWLWLRLLSMAPRPLMLPGGYRLALDELRAQLGAPDATDVEVQYFAECSNRLDLSHFREELALVGRWDRRQRRAVHRPIITVAGRRVIAHRTGRLRGVEGPMWAGPR